MNANQHKVTTANGPCGRLLLIDGMVARPRYNEPHAIANGNDWRDATDSEESALRNWRVSNGLPPRP